MRKLTDIILIFFTLLAGFALVLSYLSVYVNPTTLWFLALVGLSYPFLLLINLAFLIYWIVRWKGYFLYPAIAILLGIAHLSSFFQFPFGKSQEVNAHDLKIISYNVNLFQLYSWSKKPPTFDDIFTFIKGESPDIVCMQEFYVDKKFTETTARDKFKHNVHFGWIVKRSNSAYGLVTCSRYPIVGSGEIKFEESVNACIYTDVLVDNDTIRVYNNHLQSFRFKEKNLNFLLNQNYRKDANKMEEIKDISTRYRDALRMRAKQVDIVTNHILNSPYPAIVCGDFNESPISFNYRKMTRNLNDAFIEAGVGVGNTYRGFFPSFRIDYVLYNPTFTATSYYNPYMYHSDHFPVVATLRKVK